MDMTQRYTGIPSEEALQKAILERLEGYTESAEASSTESVAVLEEIKTTAEEIRDASLTDGVTKADVDPTSKALKVLPPNLSPDSDTVSIGDGTTKAAVDADSQSLKVLQRALAPLDDTVSIGDGVSRASVDLATGGLMVKHVTAPGTQVGVDAGGRTRISQMTTLFDGKTLNSDNTLIFDNRGTGTGLWAANKYNMTVTSGQYLVRQARRFAPYFSGKSQFVEFTLDGFQHEAGVTKRIGYFSSNETAPYDTALDGFFMESDGESYSFKTYRAGTLTNNIPSTSFNMAYGLSFELLDFSKFNVFAVDFLWLGGAVLRLFLKTQNGFELIHTINYAGTAEDVFILSPNQPLRAEIRGVSGAGSMRYICSQISTEGSINEEGYNGAVHTGSSAITCGTTGTKYPIKAIRKKAGFRDISVKMTGVSIFTATANDQILWTVELNPTLSSALTFADGTNTAVEQATGNGTITVTAPGRILSAGYVATNAPIDPAQFDKDYLAYLGVNLDGTRDPLVLCVTPISGSVGVFGGMHYKEMTN